jgi:glutathione S-transferase
MRAWRIPLSINVERVALALGHKQLHAEWIDVDASDRSEVIAISGQSRVPVLQDDHETIVAGSTAIIEHLDRLFVDNLLFPPDPRGSEVRLFVEWFEGVWKPTAGAIENELVDHHTSPNHALLSTLRTSMMAALDLLDGLLANRDFLFGEQPTAADFVAFPFIKFAALGLPRGDEKLFHRIIAEYQPLSPVHTRLRDWIARVNALPRG